MNDVELQAVEDAYALLRKGLGHEKVNDGNVAALIRRAEQDGHSVLATELREWQSPCGPGPARPGAEGVTARSQAKH